MVDAESLIGPMLNALEKLSREPEPDACKRAAVRLSWTMRQLSKDDEFWDFDPTAPTADDGDRIELQHYYLKALTAVDFSALLVARGYRGEPRPEIAACWLTESIASATELGSDPAVLRRQLREMATLLQEDMQLMAQELYDFGVRDLTESELEKLRYKLGIAWGLINKMRVIKTLFVALVGTFFDTAFPWLFSEVPLGAKNAILLALGATVLTKLRGEVMEAWKTALTRPSRLTQESAEAVARTLTSDLLQPSSLEGHNVDALRIETLIPARLSTAWPPEDPTEKLRIAAAIAGAQLATAYSVIALNNYAALQSLNAAAEAVIAFRLRLVELQHAFADKERDACLTSLERARNAQNSIAEALRPLYPAIALTSQPVRTREPFVPEFQRRNYDRLTPRSPAQVNRPIHGPTIRLGP